MPQLLKLQKKIRIRQIHARLFVDLPEFCIVEFL